jgi:polar amino acid transport system substrate-binding protein
MKKPTPIFRLSVIFALFLFALPFGCDSQRGSSDSSQSQAVQPASSYDQIIDSGKIRAAYINYPPGCVVDSKTGQISGIFVEILQEIGRKAKLEVVLTEEVGYATMIQGLESKRYDIVASPVWANTARGKLTTFSVPVYYSAFGIWVRADETRFSADDKWESINKPDVRIAALDGSFTTSVAKVQFPNAQLISHPDMSSPAELFLDVVSGKADIFLAEPEKGIDYLKSNPGTIKNIAVDPPLRIFPNVFLMPKNEFQIKNMIDAGILELQISGYLDDLLRKYDRGPDVYYRVTKPYEAPVD